MCVSEVGRLVEIRDRGQAVADVDGRSRMVSLVALVLDGHEPAPGDWLLLHSGFAVEVLDEPWARELTALVHDIRNAGDDEWHS